MEYKVIRETCVDAYLRIYVVTIQHGDEYEYYITAKRHALNYCFGAFADDFKPRDLRRLYKNGYFDGVINECMGGYNDLRYLRQLEDERKKER